MISIILPSYNRTKTINRCIDSLLNQTISDIEIIVVDDASTDNTFEIIKMYNDDRIKYIRLEKNGGSCKARNIGIDYAQGDYIAFQDSDDEWFTYKLEKQCIAMKKHAADIVYCAYQMIDDREDTIQVLPHSMPPEIDTIDNTFHRMLLESTCSTQTILCTAECAKNIRFDESLPRLQDWDWAIRATEKYKTVFLREPLVKVYIQNDSITRFHSKYVVAINLMYNKYKEKIEKNKVAHYYWIGHIADGKFGMGQRIPRECFIAFYGTHKIKYLIKGVICLANFQKLFIHHT